MKQHQKQAEPLLWRLKALSLLCIFLTGAAVAVAGGDKDQEMASNPGVADLPRAGGKIFYSLDSYLDHLKQLGGHDVPFYEKLPDGRYVQSLGRSASRQQTFYTREQLEEKFGFSKK